MASLYSELTDALLEKISKMDKGDRLPSERQLCLDYGVSRTTVRNALSSLVNSGILYQVQGKGTFVRERNRENLSNYYSFTEQTKKNGKTPLSIVLDFKIDTADGKERQVLKLSEGDKVIRFDRLRLADDVPMMFETTAVPYEKFSKISKTLLKNKALYDIFADAFKVKIYRIKERFSVDSLSHEVSSHLKLKAGNPCLRITRLTYDLEENIIEYTKSYARGDMFYYETSYSPQ